MVVSFLLRSGAIFIACVSILLVVLEKQLPFQDSLSFEELPQSVQLWHKRGFYVKVFDHQMFVVQSGPTEVDEDVVVFFHGFPCSSFDYAKSLPFLMEDFPNKRLVFFDHLGFGFSDKPQSDYEYTLHDHAENSLELLRQLKIKSAHIVAHDMGDSIVTEILLRRHLKLLPDQFKDIFKSVTFTNGGMHFDSINMRLTQILLNIPYFGSFFSSLNTKLPPQISGRLASKQLASIWSPNANEAERDEDIEAIRALMMYKNGTRLNHKTCSYLQDRARFESRWYRALKKLDIPCMILWGDSDAVAPMEIPKHLAMNVIPQDKFNGKVMKDVGHFLMLEKPQEWSKTLSNFILKLK